MGKVCKIYVDGIRDKPITKEDLKLYFGKFGPISDRETDKSWGSGFVQFNDHHAVNRIVLNKFHQINGVSVKVKKAGHVEGAGEVHGQGDALNG
jgi:RNA recognition motif-containing protein